jgi:hypothetical protein
MTRSILIAEMPRPETTAMPDGPAQTKTAYGTRYPVPYFKT